MTVGGQANSSTIDVALTNLSLGLRDLCNQIHNLNTQINGQGNGTATLEALGYSAADAATALTYVSYLNNIAGCYYGTVQQGGSGGTGAILFDFDNALSPLWAGR